MTTNIEEGVIATMKDIAKDNHLEEAEALDTLNSCAADMSAIEKAQMLEALDGVRFGSIKELAHQITLINEGQKREQDGKMRPSSE